MTYCMGCANEYDDGKKFCKLCGSKLIPEKLNREDATEAPLIPLPSPGRRSTCRPDGTIRPLAGRHRETAGSGRPETEESGPALTGISKRRGALAGTVVSVILLVSAAYCGYSGYVSSVPAQKFRAETATKVDHGPKVQQVMPPSRSPEDQIRHTFETLRQANLAKDISLFMSCYSSKFLDFDKKRKVTLRNWKKYNYTSLDFRILKLRASSSKALARIEWLMDVYPNETGKALSLNTSFDVVLEPEDGRWKVVSLEKI